MCFLVCASVCVYCFLSDVWEGVGKRNIRATGRVSSRHSPLNCEPLFFLKGAGCRAWLVTKVSMRHVTFHLIAIAGFQAVDGSWYTHL